MSAFAPITVSLDAVPTTEVLSPQSINPMGVAKWLGTASSLDAKKSVTMQVVLPSGKGTVARVKQRITIPQMDPVTGLKVGEAYVHIEAVFPKSAPSSDRSKLRYAAMDVLNDAVTIAAYDSLEAIY